jgi:hypothetical protein
MFLVPTTSLILISLSSSLFFTQAALHGSSSDGLHSPMPADEQTKLFFKSSTLLPFSIVEGIATPAPLVVQSSAASCCISLSNSCARVVNSVSAHYSLCVSVSCVSRFNASRLLLRLSFLFWFLIVWFYAPTTPIVRLSFIHWICSIYYLLETLT